MMRHKTAVTNLERQIIPSILSDHGGDETENLKKSQYKKLNLPLEKLTKKRQEGQYILKKSIKELTKKK